MRKRKSKKSFVIIIIAVLLLAALALGFISLPESVNKKIRSFSVNILGKDTVNDIEKSLLAIREDIDSSLEVSGGSKDVLNTTSYKSDNVSGLEIPKRVKDHQVVDQTYYTICWNSKYKVADWVAYTITREHLNNSVASRTEDFREDPKVPTTSTLSDYRNSGYDRGHLFAAASAKYSEEAMSSTFLLTNIVPQAHRYNSMLYLKAEDAERDAARQYGTLYAVSGPVIREGVNYNYIGSGVLVPLECYKALLVIDKDNNVYTISLVLPQDYQNGNLRPYLLTVNELEYLTGIDFFPELDDSIEELVEDSYDLSKWPEVFRK